jgi:hypothetical protein
MGNAGGLSSTTRVWKPSTTNMLNRAFQWGTGTGQWPGHCQPPSLRTESQVAPAASHEWLKKAGYQLKCDAENVAREGFCHPHPAPVQHSSDPSLTWVHSLPNSEGSNICTDTSGRSVHLHPSICIHLSTCIHLPCPLAVSQQTAWATCTLSVSKYLI